MSISKLGINIPPRQRRNLTHSISVTPCASAPCARKQFAAYSAGAATSFRAQGALPQSRAGRAPTRSGLAWREIASLAKDALDTTTDVSTVAQTETLISLTSALVDMFNIKSFGGHRRFALNDSDSRTCPGENGLRFVHRVRLTLNLKAPTGA